MEVKLVATEMKSVRKGGVGMGVIFVNVQDSNSLKVVNIITGKSSSCR